MLSLFQKKKKEERTKVRKAQFRQEAVKVKWGKEELEREEEVAGNCESGEGVS